MRRVGVRHRRDAGVFAGVGGYATHAVRASGRFQPVAVTLPRHARGWPVADMHRRNIAGGAPRPSRDDLAAAYGRTIGDVVAPALRVLFAGINPSLYSGATGHHFARPGNRFWPALARCGLTPRQLRPAEQLALLNLGLGLTNVVARATARAEELDDTELRAGGAVLEATIARYRPHWLAVVGISAFRTAFDRPAARVGPQPETLAGARIWVLPNPSGLNARWSADALAGEFGRLRAAIDPA